ncbi:MAG: DUF2141 domain-containing protein [Verrucomicrobiota bacterium]
MKILAPLFLAVFIPTILIGDEDGVNINITISNIPGVKGNLLVGLFDDESDFTKNPLPNSPKVAVTTTEPVAVTIPNVPPGRYAISVIQDLNENGKLDKSLVGMPKEPLAFSVIKVIPRGKPKFDSCAFTVGDGDVELTISLVTK